MENRIGFGKRLGAFLLDILLCGILAFFGGATLGGMLGVASGVPATSGTTPLTSTQMSSIMTGAMAGAVVGFLAIALLYNLLEGFTGWTLGKVILGIQVGNQDGTKANLGQLLYRYALKNCNAILSILALLTGIHLLKTIGNLGGLAIFVGCFFVLTSAHQAFHDMIAKTAVYPRSKLAA